MVRFVLQRGAKLTCDEKNYNGTKDGIWARSVDEIVANLEGMHFKVLGEDEKGNTRWYKIKDGELKKVMQMLQ